MKQNDWLVASLNNPNFTAQDFKDVSGLSLDNTQFLSKDYYKQSNYIKNQKAFQNDKGVFDEAKFDDYYNKAASTFKDFSVENIVDNYEYSIWDVNRPVNGRIKSINFNLGSISNPDHIKVGIEGINEISYSDKSRRELAQNSKIYDPSTGKFLDKSVNDISLFSNPVEYIKSLFDDPLVYATYDKDTIEVDPFTGNKVKHKKGEWKTNADGEYYTEKLNGRSLQGKQVVSTEDYITNENSALNSIDFFDSDDKEKSVAGTIAKNVAAVIPLLIPYVGGATKIGGVLKAIPEIYSGLMVGREIAKSMPMAYGMINSMLGNKETDSKLMNTIAAYGQKFTGSTSDYAQEQTFAFENIGNLMSDVALQWGQQKLIANTMSKLSNGGEKALQAANAKASQEYIEQANKYMQQFYEGKITAPQMFSYIGLDKAGNPMEVLNSGAWTSTALGKAALNKYIPAAEAIFSKRNRISQNLSLAYMSLISNTDVYDSILEKGGTPEEAAAIAFGSMVGMYSVDRYLGLGEMFLEKDPARKALRQVARENANVYMEGQRKLAGNIAEDLTTKQGIVNKIKQGIDLGRNSINNFLNKYKEGTVGIVGKALGEGAEEVSEELVTDLTKNLGELAGKLGYFSQTDYGAFENAGARYGMSFLGGSLGGAMFGGVEAWNNRNKATHDFQHDLVDLIRQGKKDDVLNELYKLKNKGELGSAQLSYDFTTNSEGTQTQLTADNNHESQADYNYRQLSNIINQLDVILNENNLNLNDDEIFDKMVQGEYRAKTLSDWLKGDNIESIKEASYISKYQDDLSKLTNEIVDTEQKIKELNNESDTQKRKDPKYLEDLNKLQQKKQELEKQKEYLFGEGSLGYVEKTLFAMDTNLSSNFLNLNIHQFARQLTGKSLESLTPAELETVQKRYKNNKDKKYELDEAFSLYKKMEQQLTPELKELSDSKLDSEFKELQKIRDKIQNIRLLKIEDKLPIETDEEYASLSVKSDTETEEEFEVRKKAHEKAIHEYNIAESTRWLQEFTKNPITSTDFRYLESRIGITKQEILKYALDNIAIEENGIKKHWWEVTTNISNLQKYLDLQNKDLYNLILLMGIDNETSLREAIKDRIKQTSSQMVGAKYNNFIFDSLGENEVIGILKGISNPNIFSTEEKLEYGIPLDYEFNSDTLTYKDLAIYLKAFSILNGIAPGDVLSDSNQAWNDISSSNQLSEFAQYYADSIINPNVLNSEIGQRVIDKTQDAKNKEQEELENTISNTYFSQFDKFIQHIKNQPAVKQLDALAASTFIKNPVIPILSKIASFHSGNPINLEDLLQSVYDIYKSKENDSDFQLSESQVQQLEQILKDMDIAEAYIKGASVKISDGQPIGHNKFINDFIKNHSDVFKNAQELTEIDSNKANIYLNEIRNYRKEINSWLNKHKLNSGAREAKFIKADEALTKTIMSFFDLNREGFKLDNVDLLDGYEDLTKENNLSSVIAIQQLLFKNFQESGLSVSNILDKLSTKVLSVDQAIGQNTSKLNEELTYDKFTQYDKFQLIVSSIAVDSVKFYKQLKSFLDANENLAPISIQEYVGKLSFAQKENPELINDSLVWLKSKTNSKLDIAWNTSIITGLGGSGKTFAAIRLNLGEGDNTWVSGPTDSQVKNLKKSLPKSEEKSKKDLMDLVIGTPNPDLKTFYKTGTQDDVIVPILNDDIKFNKIDNAPKNLVIDEATHFNTVELLLISKFCKENNIKLFILGDEHQEGVYTKNKIGNLETNSLLAWRTPDLYISLRNGNQVKMKNQEPLLQIIDKIEPETIDTLGDTLYNDIFKNLNLQYYNQEVFAGEMIADNISDDVLSKIPKDATIGYVGNADEYYDKLKNVGFNVSEVLTPNQVQGQEFDYVIINKNWNLNIDDNWHNNNIRIRNFAKDLYTMITRSTKGTILIDNGLSDLISCSETKFFGEYKGINEAISKFRQKRIPEIEKAIQDNPEISTNTQIPNTQISSTSEEKPQKSEEISLIDDTSFRIEELESEKIPEKKENNLETVQESKIEEAEFSVYPENPITCYSSVSFSGINTTNEEWVNDNNSTEDLGIFIKPGEKVQKGQKRDLMTRVLQFKNIFQYGYSDWDNTPLQIRQNFTEDSIKNAKYFIKIETPSDSNRLIGLTKGSGLTNDERAYKGKILKLVAKIIGKDGVTYTLSLGGLNKPSTWKTNETFLKSIIKKKIDSGLDTEGILQKQYDTYSDSIAKYENLVDEWVKQDQEIELANPPKFGKYTRLENLDSYYRLEDSVSTFSPYNENAPIQVQSRVHIITDEAGINPKLKGKPVMYVTSNLLLKPDQLATIYKAQLEDSSLPKQVRMVLLGNVGVSFESLYDKKWSELYNITAGKRKFTTPMRLIPFGFRMYKAMWNYRADLERFLEKYDSWRNQHNLEDQDVNKLCKRDNKAYQQFTKESQISEQEYRQKLQETNPEEAKILSQLWDFNDSLSDYVREFRLGYSSDHGAYIRKLTNIDSKFYDNPDNVAGIYINPQIARTQQTLLKNIFENVIDQYIPPFKNLTKSYMSLDEKGILSKEGNQEFKDWVGKLKTKDTISLEFQSDSPDTKTQLSLDNARNKLATLPITMIKLAHYMKVAMNSDLEDFKERVHEAFENEENYYTLKINDKVLNWVQFIDDLEGHVNPRADGDFKETIPGIIPFSETRGQDGNIISQKGAIDSRVKDLFNLMFHGIVSSKIENDFTRDFPRASVAEFKYGIFSDPILCELTKEEKGFSDYAVTSNKFFSSNTVASGGLIQLDLNPKKQEKSDSTIKPVTKIEDILEQSEQEKYHNAIEPQLQIVGISIDPTKYNTFTDYLSKLQDKVQDNLQDYLFNNTELNFNNIIAQVTTDKIILLKDVPELKGKEFNYKGSDENGEPINQITMTDGTKYLLTLSPQGSLIVNKVNSEKVLESNENSSISSEQALNLINQAFEGIDEDILENFELNSVIPLTWQDGVSNEITKKSLSSVIGAIGNKINEVLEDQGEDMAEELGLTVDEFKQMLIDRLKSLQETCFI